MAENTTPKPRKSAQVSTTVAPEVFDALEDHRWTARKKMTEVVAEAVQDYIVKHNIEVKSTETPATPGADAKTEKAPAKA